MNNTILRHVFPFGKIAYDTLGRRTNEATVEMEVRQQPAPENAAEVTAEVRNTGGRLELSICGSIWNHLCTDIRSGGQNLDTMRQYLRGNATFERLYSLWTHWHLNSLHAGCSHQRAAWDESEDLEIVTYRLTNEAREMRKSASRRIVRSVAAVEPVQHPTATERALLLIEEPCATVHTPPDADSPLSGCYEVAKRETKKAGWVYPREHPRGLLTKPCPTCGYEYGSAWVHESLPEEVLREIEALTGKTLPREGAHAA